MYEGIWSTGCLKYETRKSELCLPATPNVSVSARDAAVVNSELAIGLSRLHP